MPDSNSQYHDIYSVFLLVYFSLLLSARVDSCILHSNTLESSTLKSIKVRAWWPVIAPNFSTRCQHTTTLESHTHKLIERRNRKKTFFEKILKKRENYEKCRSAVDHCRQIGRRQLTRKRAKVILLVSFYFFSYFLFLKC